MASRSVGSNARHHAAPTIYDVAAAAGVSASTVSRALNRPGRVSAATERLIRGHAERLGYQLNPLARAVITGRSDTFGLILSDITNPVYFDLIRGAEKASSAQARTLILAESQESAEEERAVAQRLQVSVDGLILVSSRMSDDTIVALAGKRPVVAVNRVVPGVTSIALDVERSLRAVLDHLHGLGHRSVAYLSGPPSSWMNRARWTALFSAAVALGMSIVEIPSASPTLDGGRLSLERILASNATAVVAYNDLLALGLLAASRDAGVDVPGRLSLVGFDDIFGADLVTPALTTVRSPLDKLGELAVESLLSADADSEARRPPDPELIVRHSTAAPRM